MRINIAKHGLVELNHLTASATRAIEAQTPVKAGISTLENGMILFIDRLNDVLTFEKVSGPYLHFSTERYYTVGERGKANFIFQVDNNGELPRVWKLAEGDVFHTNVLKIGTFSTEAALDTALANNGKVFGYVDGTDGVIYATATPVEGEAVEFIIAASTMQDDTKGFKILVNKADSVAAGTLSI
jgi:hypothetical protein